METLPQEPKQKFCLKVHKHVARNTHVRVHTCLGFTAAFLPPTHADYWGPSGTELFPTMLNILTVLPWTHPY